MAIGSACQLELAVSFGFFLAGLSCLSEDVLFLDCWDSLAGGSVDKHINQIRIQ
jgi:hypothetical protein